MTDYLHAGRCGEYIVMEPCITCIHLVLSQVTGPYCDLWMSADTLPHCPKYQPKGERMRDRRQET